MYFSYHHFDFEHWTVALVEVYYDESFQIFKTKFEIPIPTVFDHVIWKW